MAAYLPLFYDQQFLANTGSLGALYLLYTYDDGTTTPKATYTDAAGTTPNPNPITLDSAGRPSSAIFLGDGSYSFELKTTGGVLVKRWDGVTSASASIGPILSDLSNIAVSTKGVGMVGYSPAVTYPLSTIGAMLGRRVLVDVYGGNPSASAATNLAAFNSAKAALGSFGGRIEFGRGTYQFAQELVVDVDDVIICGQGSSANHNTGLTSTTGATILSFTNLAGACIRFQGLGGGTDNIVIAGDDASRYAQAYSKTTPAVRVEAADTANGASRRTHIHRTHILKQPGPGVVLIGDLVQTLIDYTDIDNVKGEGVVIDDGTYTGRTNKQRPGQVSLHCMRISRTGGPALRIGDATQGDNGRPYRIGGYMIECFLNRQDSATFTSAYNWIVGGENMQFELCATGGESQVGVPDHAGIYTWGLYNAFRNHRFVDCETYCAYVDDPPGAGAATKEIIFEQLYINNDNHGPGYYNPAFFIDPGATNVKVIYNGASSDIGTLISADYGQHETQEGNLKVFQGTSVSALRGYPTSVSIANNTAVAVLFPIPARGILLMAGSVEAANQVWVAFRCGDGSAFVNLPVNSGTGIVFDGGVGVLTGTTGPGGQINIKVDNAQNKIYIENQTGSTRTYFFALLCSNSEIQSIS